jgi:hypothetical protein
VLIVNDPIVAFAATVTDAGTVSPERPVLLSVTTAPLDPADFDNVTVQVPLAFAPKVAGLHCNEEITAAVARLMLTVCEPFAYAAVTEPLWSAAKAPVLITNEAEVAFAGTVTEGGSVSTGSPELLKVTTAPLDPAAFDSVTVQVPLAFAPKVVGLHCSEERTADTAKDTVEDFDIPLYVAVTPAV